MKVKEAMEVTGSLGYPSKMPGTSYGLSASKCITGGKLQNVMGSTCHDCYAMKGNYVYPSVVAAHEKRLAGIYNPAWPAAMARMLKAAHTPSKRRSPQAYMKWLDADGNPIYQLPPYHRWHDSGDLQSEAHLAAICEVARLTPELQHWLPTRELTIVLNYIKAGGVIPGNLMVRVSATMVDGNATRAWPFTSGVHEATTPPLDQVCPAPLNENACGACRKCWHKSVRHVSYHKH